MRLNRQIAAWSRLRRRNRKSRRQSGAIRRTRDPVTHVVILDGTMSSLAPGCETNPGQLYKLLRREGPRAGLSLFYEAGIQWPDWVSTPDVAIGRGLNRKIRRAYGFLASRYRPGDRIFLFGYSRGGFAVRSLAGVIDAVGLLKPQHATVRHVRQAYRHYQCAPGSVAAQDFARTFCHDGVCVDMLGVWDTVKALGLRLPFVWRLTEPAHAFHNHQLGSHVRRGFHALAHDETRLAFAPEMWRTSPDEPGQARAAGDVEQRWFPGAHGDVGGQLGGYHAARPLANLSLVWMLEKAEAADLPLPPDWRHRFPTDPDAPSVGTMRGWGKLFVLRARRPTGRDPSETFHPSIGGDQALAAAVAAG